MPLISAGLLMYRVSNREPQVLLVHPGGPFFQRKDEGVWTIPKGEVASSEDLLAAARREFHEETGLEPTEPFFSLAPIKQKSGKLVHAWVFAGDCDPARLRSNTFQIEWPPKSGRQVEFPEVDRAEFFDLATARQKIIPAQARWIDDLEQMLSDNPGSPLAQNDR